VHPTVIREIRKLSLVAVDSSGDALHSELHPEQTQEVYDNFMRYVRDRLRYRFISITTDLDVMLENAIRGEIGPKIRHQKCLWHVLERVKEYAGYQQQQRRRHRVARELMELEKSLANRKQSLYDAGKRVEVLRDIEREVEQALHVIDTLLGQLRDILFAPQQDQSTRLWKLFRRRYRRSHPQIVALVAKHWDGLLHHQHDSNIPKTTVMAENFNKQLERRLKTIEAFQCVETAANYQNLYRNFLRFKPYTDCRGSRRTHNGLSPLILCKAKLSNTDWLKNAIRNP